ncbi:MAG: cell division protein FtsL [Burkholderiaceae bacterium]|nr:cell division protein FtsL [Burkholderiaceae bacterium]
MTDSNRSRLIVALLAVCLMASALALITAQHRARDLFADLEVAQQLGRQREAEGNRLRIELGRASQPAVIEAAARAIGMRPIDPDHTTLLPPTPRGEQPAEQP